MKQQDDEGCIGPRGASKYMYGHCMCALALSEACGLTASNVFKDQAQKTVNFIVAAQNPGKGCELLLQDKPRWDGKEIDFLHWYLASVAILRCDSPKKKEWSKDLEGMLGKNQNPPTSGCRRGSWEPVDRWGAEGGRVYATATNVLSFRTYVRRCIHFNTR